MNKIDEMTSIVLMPLHISHQFKKNHTIHHYVSSLRNQFIQTAESRKKDFLRSLDGTLTGFYTEQGYVLLLCVTDDATELSFDGFMIEKTYLRKAWSLYSKWLIHLCLIRALQYEEESVRITLLEIKSALKNFSFPNIYPEFLNAFQSAIEKMEMSEAPFNFAITGFPEKLFPLQLECFSFCNEIIVEESSIRKIAFRESNNIFSNSIAIIVLPAEEYKRKRLEQENVKGMKISSKQLKAEIAGQSNIRCMCYDGNISYIEKFFEQSEFADIQPEKLFTELRRFEENFYQYKIDYNRYHEKIMSKLSAKKKFKFHK